MSLSAVLNSALTSIEASQLGIAVSSNNIANAQNPDYSRQRLVTSPGPTEDGRVRIGTGINVVGVEALRNKMIDLQRQQETSNKAAADLTNRTLGDIEVQFTDTNDTGMLQGLSNFFNSFQTLSADPGSSNFRQQVLTNATSLITQFKSMHDNLAGVKSLVNQSIDDKEATINNLAKQIAQVTGQIANSETSGPANDLRDQRSGLVQQMAALVDVKETETPDKFYQLTIGDNRLLVFGTKTTPIGAQEDLTGKVNSGELKAAMDLRDTYIPKYMNSLDQMASEVVQKVNEIHSAGYDQNGNSGINFFQPLASSTNAASLISLDPAVAGDPTKIVASAATGQDNQAAMQLGNLLFQPVFTGGSITDQYRNLVFNVGSDVSNSAVSLKQHEALAQQLDVRRQAVSGVSVDEETIQILQFQRSYQAAARLIKTVDELTQSLLNL